MIKYDSFLEDNYGRTPLTWAPFGNRKQVELAGVWVMGWCWISKSTAIFVHLVSFIRDFLIWLFSLESLVKGSMFS